MVVDPRVKRELAKPVVTEKAKSWEIEVIHAVDMYAACPLRSVNSRVHTGSWVHAGCPFIIANPWLKPVATDMVKSGKVEVIHTMDMYAR